MRLDRHVYANRRRAFIEEMGDDGVAVFTSPPERLRSQDTNYPYRPSSDILYLTGFEEPDTVVILSPGHDDGDFVMFVPPRDPEKEMWDGYRAGPEGAEEHFGADKAYPIGELEDRLPGFLEDRDVLHYTLGRDDAFDGRVTGWINGLRYRRGAPPAAPRFIADARDIIHEMRVRKSSEELDVMREAARISSEAHQLAMRICAPGKQEFEIQAAMEHHFRRNGANYPAYTSIVGGGQNATVLHYIENRAALKDGEVLLIDAGAEYNFYAADITRSFPVNGTFTGPQRDAYAVILEAQKAAIDDIEPGRPYAELQERTVRRLTEGLIELGVLEGSLDENIESENYKPYYPHKVGHWLGMDVHDVGSYYTSSGDARPLEPGMVLTVEPGLYFPVDADVPAGLKGVGIRIEDDVLVTESGRENLTIDCPKEIADIEAMVGTEA